MRNRLVVAALFLMILGGVYGWRNGHRKLQPAGDEIAALANLTESTDDPKAQDFGSVGVSGAAAAPARGEQDRQALQMMTRALADYARVDRRPEQLMEFLKDRHEEPVLMKTENPYTGAMAVVRTQNPAPGTRYFHAQYLPDAGGEMYIQHMSFEFLPGADSMQEAVAAVQASFNDLGTPTTRADGFVQWALPNGYVVWVKKLDKNDLAYNPTNAYTLNDLGTVRVAVEQVPLED